MVTVDPSPSGLSPTFAPALTPVASDGKQRLSPLVFMYLACVLIPVFFQLGPLFMSGLRLFLLFALLPLLFGLLSGRYGKLIITDYAFILHILWMAVAFAVNHPEQLIEHVGVNMMEFLGGYLMGRAFIRTRSDFIQLCKALTYITAAMLPLALYETRTGNTPIVEFIRSLPGVSSVRVHSMGQRLGLHRVQGTMAHAIHFGLFCSIAFSLCFVGLQGVISTQRRVILSGILFVCTFLALSAGALVALVLQMGLITWYLMLRKFENRWVLLFWLAVLAYIVVDLLSNRRPIDVFMTYATFNSHTAYWRMLIFEWGLLNVIGSAANDIPSNLLVGIGLRDWVRPSFMHTDSVDNFWLLIAMRYGVPGFFFLVLGYLGAIWQIARRRDISHDTVLLNLRRAWMFTFIGLTFTLFTVHVWTSLYSFVFFIFGAGIWMIHAKPVGEDGAADGEMPPLGQSPSGTRHSRFAHTHTRTGAPSDPSSELPSAPPSAPQPSPSYARLSTPRPSPRAQ